MSLGAWSFCWAPPCRHDPLCPPAPRRLSRSWVSERLRYKLYCWTVPCHPKPPRTQILLLGRMARGLRGHLPVVEGRGQPSLWVRLNALLKARGHPTGACAPGLPPPCFVECDRTLRVAQPGLSIHAVPVALWPQGLSGAMWMQTDGPQELKSFTLGLLQEQPADPQFRATLSSEK